MRQNTSTAVMQRRVEAHDSLDDFPTPPWATRAMLHHILGPIWGPLSQDTVWEPAANRGYMVRALAGAFSKVLATDIMDYQYGFEQHDFLFPHENDEKCDWVITNPPFRLAEQFIEKGLRIARRGVAVIVRTSFLEGVGRYESLFSKMPPSIIAQHCERVPMVKGKYDPQASTATSYAWLIWAKNWPSEPVFKWIPKSKASFERAGDVLHWLDWSKDHAA